MVESQAVLTQINGMIKPARVRLLTGLLLCCSCSLLSGCGKAPAQAMLEDYADSMSNVLDTPIELALEEVMLDLPMFPEKRERMIPTTEIREGVMEVWDFKRCGMINLIAERNSTLGKVMLPSQKMKYELHFIAALQACQAKMQALAEPDAQAQTFIERLAAIQAIKQANLPAEIWNGIYTSDEISQHFASGKPPLDLPESNESSHRSVQTALEQLKTLAEQADKNPVVLPQWLDKLEDTYYNFYTSNFGAALLPSLRILTHTLNQTAAAIEQRLADSPFCYPSHRPRRAEVLRNIFQKYYAEQVQPYMALIQREGKPWLETHADIMTKLKPPAAMQTYQQQVISLQAKDSLWQQWLQASQRHTQAWQDILGQCGMMPGQDR